MRGTARAVIALALLAGAVVLAQAALPTMDAALTASPATAKFAPAKTPHSEGVMQAPVAADPPPGGSVATGSTSRARAFPSTGTPTPSSAPSSPARCG